MARGDELADVVIQGGQVFSAFTREWLETDVAICDGFVAGLGEYAGREVIHAGGTYVVPGFVDAHMHLESSKLLVDVALISLTLATDMASLLPGHSTPRASAGGVLFGTWPGILRTSGTESAC